MTPTSAPVSLAEFVLARIAEDEAAAREITKHEPPKWHYSPDERPFMNGKGVVWNGAGQLICMPLWGAGALIARYDPARVLAECEAKRRIVEVLRDQERRADENAQEHTEESSRDPRDWDRIRQLRTFGWELQGRLTALRETVKLLATAYADHPDYRPEWRP